jgi:hypothetical protein
VLIPTNSPLQAKYTSHPLCRVLTFLGIKYISPGKSCNACQVKYDDIIVLEHIASAIGINARLPLGNYLLVNGLQVVGIRPGNIVCKSVAIGDGLVKLEKVWLKPD